MKYIKSLAIFLGLAVILGTSCDDAGSETIFSETFVELVAAGTSSGRQEFTYLRQNDGVNKASGWMVSLASQPLDQAVNITFEVVAGSTTGIENVHYVVNSNTVTIPAGQNLAELPIDIIADNIEAGETFDITIRLVSADVRVEQGLDVATHRIQISCPSNLEGNYSYVSTATNGSPGFWNFAGTVSLTRLGDFSYELSDFAAGAFGSPRAMPINDICGAITEGSPDQGLGTITSGTVDGTTGVITIDFELTCCGGNNGDTWQYVLTPQ